MQATEYQDMDLPLSSVGTADTLPVPERPQRMHRLPRRFIDHLPEAAPAVAAAASDELIPIIPRVRLIVHDVFKTITMHSMSSASFQIGHPMILRHSFHHKISLIFPTPSSLRVPLFLKKSAQCYHLHTLTQA